MKNRIDRMLRVLPLAAAALAFSGCSALTDKWTITTVEDSASGAAPVRYKATITSYLEDQLADPFSAHYRQFSAPQRHIQEVQVVTQSPTLINVHGRMTVTNKHCWMVTVDVNAKNRYGAYTGWVTYVFLFKGEDIMSVHTRSVS